MIAKKYGENEIRMMFSSFGQTEECRILRGPDGQSRGRCAFSVGTVLSASQPPSSASTSCNHVFIQAPPYFFISTPSKPSKTSAIHLQWHPFHPHSPIPVTLSLHISLAVRHNGPSPWQPLAAGVRGLSWQAARLLLYRLLHPTLQRLELACRRISYIALDCMKPQIAGGSRLSS